jgi:hypothetical protein
MARQPLGGQGRLIFRGFTITLLDTPHSVGHLWTSDQPVAETSTWQHTTLTTDRHTSFAILTTWYQCTRRRNVVDKNKMYVVICVKCPIVLPDLLPNWDFSTDFHKSSQYQISRKSVQWEARWYMRTDGRTYVMALIGAFRDSTNSP